LAILSAVGIWKSFFVFPSQAGTFEDKNSSTKSDNCLDRSSSLLCFHLYPSNILQRKICLQDPKNTFAEEVASKATITKEQAQAKQIIIDHNISALSIGASSGGLCSEALHERTLCTNRLELDLFNFLSWVQLFGDTKSRNVSGNQIFQHVPKPSTVFAEHVLEHFHPIQVQLIAASVMATLQPGGVFRIAVPDGYKPSPSYQLYVRAGKIPSGNGQSHMVAWTIDNLCPIFEDMGFEVVKREYFDAQGEFHTSVKAYEDESIFGKVRRSSRHDARNQASHSNSMFSPLLPDLQRNEPWFTSLWIDVVKPLECLGSLV